MKIFLLLALLPVLSFAQPQSDMFVYSHSVDYPGGLKNPWVADPIDYNGNGTVDILVFGHTGGKAWLWDDAQGIPEFIDSEWQFKGSDPVWIDWDEDGDMDAIGTHSSPTDGFLFDNNNGTFTATELVYQPFKDLEGTEVIVIPPELNFGTHPLEARIKRNFFVDLDNDGVVEKIIHAHGKDDVTRQLQSYSWVLKFVAGGWVCYYQPGPC